jgi:hypothetical protein
MLPEGRAGLGGVYTEVEKTLIELELFLES